MASIKGLTYINDAVPNEINQEIIRWFLSQETQDSLKPITNSPNSRKVLHYGYKYNYRTRSIYEKASAIPLSILKLLEYIPTSDDDNDDYFNQCIINHYSPGQGISFHIDRISYGGTIACFTFILDKNGSSRTMYFKRGSKEKIKVSTTDGSLYIMRNAARYEWKHGMINKQPRCISVTFRNVPSLPSSIVVM